MDGGGFRSDWGTELLMQAPWNVEEVTTACWCIVYQLRVSFINVLMSPNVFTCYLVAVALSSA